MIRLAAIILLFLPALAVRPAAADYDARIQYLQEQIEAFTELPELARDQLQDGIEEYAEERESLFEDLVKTMESDRPDPDAWKEVAEDGKDLPTLIIDPLDSAVSSSSIEELDEVQELIQEESAFFDTLARANLSEEHNVVVHNAEGLEKLIRTSDEKWRGIDSKDRPIDEKNKRYWEEIVKIYDEFRKEIDDALKDYSNKRDRALSSAENVAEAVAGSIAELDTSLKVIKGVLLAAKNHLQTTHNDAMTLITYSEFEVIQEFLNTRRSTKEFVDQHGLHHATLALERAQGRMDTACGSMDAEGQEDDCEHLAKEALGALKKHYERAKEQNTRFLAAHEGRFLGKVSTAVRNDLLEESEWDKLGGRVPHDATIDLVKRMGDNYFREPPWEGAGLPDEVKAVVKEHLDDAWLEAATAGRGFLDTFMQADFRKIIELRRKQAAKLDAG